MSQIYGCAHPIAMVSRIIFVIKSYSQYIRSYSKGQQHNLMACPSSVRHHLWFQHDHCDNNIQIHIDYTTTTIYITSFIDSDVIKG